jgi:hypothetical protein
MLKLRDSLRILERLTKKALLLKSDDIAEECLLLQEAIWQLLTALDKDIPITCEIFP